MKKSRSATVSASMVQVLAAYARKFRVDFSAALASAGIDPAVLNRSDARVAAKAFLDLWQQIVRDSDDPSFGLNFGRELSAHYPAGSIVFTMMLNCRTLSDALFVLVKYHRIMADAVQPVMTSEKDRIMLSWQILFPGTEHPHLSQAILCILFSIVHTLSNGRILPEKICFAHPRPESVQACQELFNTRLEFNTPDNVLVFRKEDLDTEIAFANPALFEMLEQHAQTISHALTRKQTWSDRVIALLSRMILTGSKPTLKHISAELAVSSRSLQEKLKAEGSGFRRLSGEILREIASDRLLNPDTPVCEVAFLLGYSDQSAFNHAFKRWTGRTPGRFRRDHGISDGADA